MLPAGALPAAAVPGGWVWVLPDSPPVFAPRGARYLVYRALPVGALPSPLLSTGQLPGAVGTPPFRVLLTVTSRPAGLTVTSRPATLTVEDA